MAEVYVGGRHSLALGKSTKQQGRTAQRASFDMETSALAIMNFRPASKSYSVPDGKGGSFEVTIGEVLEIDGSHYEVLAPETIGKLYVKPVTKQ